MKNNILVIIILLLIYSPFAVGQQKIDKVTFEKLVDYANCKYVQAFIDKNDIGKSYYTDTYIKKIQPSLQIISLDNFETILPFENLKNLLYNNIPALELAKRINDRKLKFDEFEDNESLISTLVTTGWKNIDLSQTAADIQNRILSKYGSKNDIKHIKVSESEVVKTQTIQTTAQVEELQSKLNQMQLQYDNLKNDTKILEYQESLKDFKIIIISVLGVIIVFFLVSILILFIRTSKTNLREKIIRQVLESKRIEERFLINDRTNILSQSINLSEKDISLIINRVLEHKRLHEKEIEHENKTPQKEQFEQTRASTKYLKGKSGKIFSRVENTSENSFFELYNEIGDTAQFRFCGNEAEAIAKRIFNEDICKIISGSYQNAHAVITNRPGKIKRIGDQWEVTEPIEIKLV